MKDLETIDKADLARLSELGTNFASLLHEIRQPLAGMRLSLNLALKLVEAPEAIGVLEDVLSQVERLSEMVDRTSAFYQRAPVVMEDFDLNPVLERVVRMLEHSVRKHQIQLIFNAEHLPRVRANVIGVEQILFNLINNARDSLVQRGEGGRLIIITRQNAQQAEVYIADDGIGIHAKRREDIFKPFTTTKGKHGTGLGLYVAKQMTESFSGRLEILNEKMRNQLIDPPPITAFVLFIPLALEPKEDVQAQENAAKKGSVEK